MNVCARLALAVCVLTLAVGAPCSTLLAGAETSGHECCGETPSGQEDNNGSCQTRCATSGGGVVIPLSPGLSCNVRGHADEIVPAGTKSVSLPGPQVAFHHQAVPLYLQNSSFLI